MSTCTSWDIAIAQYMDLLTLIINGISISLLVFTIFGNSLVMGIIRKNKKLQNANTYLICSLAHSDFGFAVVTFVEIFLVSNDVPYSSFQFVMNALCSSYLLVALAVERYFGILKPFVHLKRASKSLITKVIIAVWLVAGVLSAGGFIIESLGRRRKNNATLNETNSYWSETPYTVYIFVLLAFGLVMPSAVMIFAGYFSRVVQHRRQQSDK